MGKRATGDHEIIDCPHDNHHGTFGTNRTCPTPECNPVLTENAKKKGKASTEKEKKTKRVTVFWVLNLFFFFLNS